MSSPISLQTSLFKEIGKKRPSFLKGVKPLLVTNCKNFAITKFEFFEHGNDLYMSAFSFWTTDNSKKYKLWFVLYDWREIPAIQVDPDDWFGDPFRDSILKIWSREHLELGFVSKAFKKLA